MLRIVDRGTASISSVLSYMLFNIFPTIADICVGVVYFVVKFNIWYGIIVFMTMGSYVGELKRVATKCSRITSFATCVS